MNYEAMWVNLIWLVGDQLGSQLPGEIGVGCSGLIPSSVFVITLRSRPGLGWTGAKPVPGARPSARPGRIKFRVRGSTHPLQSFVML